MFKGISCKEFEYVCVAHEEVLELFSEASFSVQSPIDDTLLERAVFIDFRARNQDETFKLNCKFRVMFSFEKPEDLKDGKEFLSIYQEDAYCRVKDIVQAFLKSIQQNEKAFPDTIFPE